MGTAVSFDLRDPLPSGALGRILDWLHWVDHTFSTDDESSSIRRLDRGEATVEECPPEVGLVLDLCEAMEVATDGYFSARPAGRLDVSGLVKGWAVERTARMLAAAGSARHAVGAGGAVQAIGGLGPQRPWRIGVVHPQDPERLIAVVQGANVAVATSGAGQRGLRVVDPLRRRPATDLLAVTVVGPDLTRADAFATAALAMGERAYSWLRGLRDFSAMVVDLDGCVWRTAGFPAAA